ncbi:MAG TPA: heme-binding protein [Usitatibacter sp.]|nr:heme-binding protein [Usitatibacter sp.]
MSPFARGAASVAAPAFLAVLALAPFAARGAETSATYASRELAPEAALKAAQAALASCRAAGYQVTVAVVDRAGLVRVVLRDRYAGPHTLDVSTNKAWTAATTRTPTSELAKITRPGDALAGLREVPRITALAGGLPVEAGGTLLGGIGVSGAPGGEADERCAKAGLAAIADDLEF